MDRLASLTLRDIAIAVGRYRPVAVTVVVLLALLAVLPGPRFGRAEVAAGSGGAVFRGRSGAPAATTQTTAAAPLDASLSPDAAAPTGSFSSGPAAGGFSSGPGFSTGGSFSGAGDSTGSGGSSFSGDEDAAAPDTQFEPSSPSDGGGATSGSGVTSSTPLAIVGSAYASASAATPLGAAMVPAGTLPVGKRFGQDDKYSYVRLAGQGTSLVLSVEPSGSRSTTGAASVQACRVTKADWSEGENKPMSEIPFDRTQCAPGVRDDFFGSYSFDLARFDDRTDTRGFALVPAPDASVDFQVTFKKK